MPAKKLRKKPVKAYKNEAFLNSPDARIIRIMSEFVEPLRRFKHQNVTDTIQAAVESPVGFMLHDLSQIRLVPPRYV